MVKKKIKTRFKAVKKKAQLRVSSKHSIKVPKKSNKKLVKLEVKNSKKAKKTVIGKEAKIIEKKVLELSPESKERILKILSNLYARQLIIDVAGENALEIVRTFSTSTSDEEIAKRLKIKISDVRATLNRLHSEGLVSYLREKDGETGWYSYTWMLNGEKVEQWFTDKLNEAKLKVNIDTNIELYFCVSCGVDHIHDFVSACDTQFKCPSCNKNLDFLDESRRVEILNTKMKI